MGQMYFYDIMYLYRTYEDYVNEENERQKEQEGMYNEKIEDTSNYSSQIESQMQKYNNMDYSKMLGSIPKISLPKI